MSDVVNDYVELFKKELPGTIEISEGRIIELHSVDGVDGRDDRIATVYKAPFDMEGDVVWEVYGKIRDVMGKVNVDERVYLKMSTKLTDVDGETGVVSEYTLKGVDIAEQSEEVVK